MLANRSWKKLIWTGLISLVIAPALAKDSKPIMPPYILQAHTVMVMIDPAAGISLNDPNANQTAQKDVEAAILNWGRFTTVMGTQGADLILLIRKGHGKLADETVKDPRQNSRVGAVTPTNDGISIGAQHGSQPPPSTRPTDGASDPNTQLEVGATEDSFEVYPGGQAEPGGQVADPTDGPPGWRCVRKGALHSHDVPAVDEFRKAIAEAEKQAAAQQKGKHP
jgi:hypothetical protein